MVGGLGRAIVAGRFKAGGMLPDKDDLCERFGVSHTALREALQTLAAKGLIAARTRIGTWVLEARHWNMFDSDVLAWRLAEGADLDFVASLFEVRQAFEPVAAALAAKRRSEADLVDLRRQVAAMVAAGGDKQRFSDANAAFHLGVLDASGNPIMHSIGALIATALTAAFELSAPTDDPVLEANACRQHAAIVEALARRDAQAAADAMMQVIRQGWLTYTNGPDRPLAKLSLKTFSKKGRRRRGKIASV
ncbi:MAG TPA: FadR/GntR family transcriptional regulator [Candidatus Sulfotelmatobacter sp.]|nr:FadR/GntR family transcriptional regulator [Candidatus Sulfotelmatobacter sp.]